MMVIKGHLGSTTSGPKQVRPQPIKSWTPKSEKAYEKSRENGFVPSQRVLYSKTKNPLPVKYTVRGEWELQECEEHLTWLNNVLKKKKHRPLTDLRKSVSDGLTLVNLLEILFNEKIQGVQTRPIIRAQRIENIHLCLRFLQTKGFDTRGVNAEEITDGNLRSTLALINTLRRRFENSTTSTGSQRQDSAPSTPRVPPPDGISQNSENFPSPGREPSINSHISAVSETSFGRKSGDNISANLNDGSAGRQTPSSRAMVNGHAVEPSLPGLMGSSMHEEPRPSSADNDKVVMSMTEMGSKGVLQHGADVRRTQLSKDKGHNGTIRPQPLKVPNEAWNGNNPLVNSKSPLRDTLSITVEEKLKNLLDSPTPGALTNGHLPPQFDDGELLELPPPNFRDVTDEDDNADEEANLQAMLEDPDKFDYPKDWDRYISGYVPSSATEKREGPRAQALLDRPPTETTPPPEPTASTSSSVYRPAPFFHGPSSQHMGPVNLTQSSQDMLKYSNGPPPIRPISKKLSDNLRNLSGVVYGEEGGGAYSQPSLSQTWSPPYRPPTDPSRPRHLPSYQDHIQRHTPPAYRKMHTPGASPPSSGYDSRGHSSPKTLPRAQGFQRYFPLSREQMNNQYNPNDSYQEQYRAQQERTVHFMSQSLPQPLDDHSSLHRLYNGPPSQNTAFVPVRASNPMYAKVPTSTNEDYMYASQLTQGYPQEYDPAYSESSSRSHTPPLPPLSPDITPPETPPDSPITYKKNRSSSIWVGNQQSPIAQRRNRTENASKSRKPAVGRSVSATGKLGDSKSPLRRSGGKGRRKMKHGSRSSSRANSTASKDSRKSSTSTRALPSMPLNQVLEQTEGSDSDTMVSRRTSKHTALSDDDREDETPRELTVRQSRSSSPVKDGQNVEGIRMQLMALENMYKEILQVIGANKVESTNQKTGNHGGIPSGSPKGYKPKHSKISSKQRDKDIRVVNKRFTRIESHVVTLARSVAHLSSELRSQNALIREIESLRLEVDRLKDVTYLNHHDVPGSPRRLSHPYAPHCANPQKFHKLTKFFGKEPPLLAFVLTVMGYGKYLPVFEEAEISMTEIPYLAEEMLENLGIPVGPRQRILQEAENVGRLVQNLISSPPSSP